MEPPFQGAKRFEDLVVRVDGAARGNPGPAAIGVVVLTRDGKKVASFGEFIGEATNNYAEYTALVHALRLLSVYEVERLRVLTDSELVARQVNGEYRVKDRALSSLHAQVMSMLDRYRAWEVRHVPREENAEADKLAHQALDRAPYKPKPAAGKAPPPPEGQSRLFEENPLAGKG